MKLSSKLWKPIVVIGALVTAFGITFVWPKRNSLDFNIDSQPHAQAADTTPHAHEPYDLTRLAVMNNVIVHIKEHYVDPSRINPRKMLLSGLNAIQRSVAPVIVDYEENAPTLTIQVNNQRKEFRVDDVTALWSLTPRFREIFAFLQTNLQDEEVDLREVEYSAVNGILHTLDPHSILLTPEYYADMRASTRGEFGGLGIVISIRDGQLTVIRPMPGTPAGNAGIKKGDRIVKINDESTLNLPLNEAVNRLRGAPGSQVHVFVTREGAGGFAQPRRFDLTRAIIHIESIESRMLEGGVGYIKIKGFQGNTFNDMEAALTQLHRQPMKGLVIDLRDNPGGLLDQAVKIADAFLPSGTIVTTSSNDPGERESRDATGPGTEPNYPLVVLINGGSASASEIVSGALKNHDRAVIVGQRSFGKGSVQVIYDFPDGSGLKLTTAQYLTPGDVSIQGVGIVPDIAIDPMTADAEDMDLTIDKSYVRESDLRAHLTHASARDGTQSESVLRYFLPKDARQRLREAGPDAAAEDNEKENEFLTHFSRDLILQAHRSGRREMVADAEPVLTRTRDAEMQKVAAELQKLGVDWSTAPDQGPSEAEVVVTTNKENNTATAGDEFVLRVRVTNKGTAPLYQLRATTKSDYRLFEGRELVFGTLAPGQTREWTTTLGVCETKENRHTCLLPKDIPDRADGIRVEFAESHGHAPPTAEVRTVIHALARPLFAYDLQVADNVRGNGDGQLQRGEVATMYFHVKNIGQGRSYETQANLANLSGAGILLRDGRFTLPSLAPGDERDVAFTFEVLPSLEADLAKLEVSVTDVDLREGVTEKVRLPIVAAGTNNPTAQTGAVLVRSGAVVRARPDASSPTVATAEGGIVSTTKQASVGDFVRVDLGHGRPGWIANADVTTGAAATGAHFQNELSHMPPTITVDYGTSLTTREQQLEIRGRAVDHSRLLDMYVFVGARKVFYQSNHEQANAREATFNAHIPLHGGINYIIVVARHDDDVMSRKIFVVRRDSPDGALMEAPKFDNEDEFGADADDEE